MTFKTKTLRGFRMWKSGKRWLFGTAVTASILLGGQLQAFADSPAPTNPTVIEEVHTIPQGVPEQSQKDTPVENTKTVTPAAPQESGKLAGEKNSSQEAAKKETQPSKEHTQPTAEDKTQPGKEQTESTPKNETQLSKEHTESTADNAVNEQIVKNAVSTADKPKPVAQAAQDVRIHYKPEAGDTRDYYAWVWGDTAQHKTNGRFLKMENKGGERVLTVKPDADVKSFQYIITDKGEWSGANKVSGPEDMTATVLKASAVDIYHGADGWYSQFLNVQTPEFDKKYGYTDKVVNKQGKFDVVGSKGALGATLHADGSATINVWAPTAEKVTLNVYQSTAENAPLLKQFEMIRGTDENQNDHTKNTIGLWSYHLKPSEVASTLKTLNKVAYDYTLTIPKAYFIQKTEDWYEEKPGVWKKRGDKYVNSASASKNTKEELSSTASHAQIAKMYSGPAETVTTQDPYSVAVVKNGKRSVILDPSTVGGKVTVSQNKRVNSKTKLSVLEVDVRDFSIDKSSGVTEANKGNYLGLVEKGTTDPKTGKKTGLDYLRYLGVNYLQIMPIYDYQTVPELEKNDPKNNEISKEFSANDQQNWGYDPKNYNVPEGSYATDPSDPENRIREVKTMVQKLHDAGLNLVMDVVYNHLYDGQNNPFEYTVPGYYYAINRDGKMNNDVGVGNAVRSNSEMMRQYIVNSVAYWAMEYGMDGFRFDAMSDLDVKTMKAVREAINKIDPNIVTYGEGWDSMGKYLEKDGDKPASVGNAKDTPEVGYFDSVGRDSIAGSHYDNGNPPGFVNRQSDYKHDEGKIKTLVDSLMGGHGRSFANASQQLNYVEVHDGMTLSDLLKHYNPNDTEEEHMNRVELATAMSALSQGIHFSQHGQEFLRSKSNSHNTYNAGDEKNKIDWGLVNKNADAVNFTKSLISLRKNEPLWHLSDYQKEIFKHMKITNAQKGSGIVTYELTKENGDRYLAVFNNNTSPDNNSSLTLGGNSYYYGSDKNRGDINDFSNAYVVATNSKNLYDKIGKVNGSKTITMDKLSATILYLPKAKITNKSVVRETIRYVNTNGETVSPDKVQETTRVTVQQTDPQKKFSYVKSGIGAENEKVLGYRQNILDGVSQEDKTIEKNYIATNAQGELTVANGEVTLGDDGKPVDTENVKWVLESEYNFKAVPHPQVEGYKVKQTSEPSNNLSEVPAQSTKTNVEITVTYEKIVWQVTPDEGDTAPVEEKPRLDVVTEEVPFKTIERENPQLPKGTRKVVQEGKVGEKTTLVEITVKNGQETGRVTRDSFISKAPVDQIVEIGKPVEQVTPDEGDTAPVEEKPRLDVVTEEVPFKTIERANPQLPKGTRKVVQEGRVGEKTTLVEITVKNGQETGRVTRDSFISKAPVDQIVEVGTKEEKPTLPSTSETPTQDQMNKPTVTQVKKGKTEAPTQEQVNKKAETLPNTGTASDSAFLLGLLMALTGVLLMKKKEE